jgi:hypothetical protein
MGSFIDECVQAVPVNARPRYRLWIRVDSAGYQQQVLAAADRHRADFSVTAKGYPAVLGVVHALAADPGTGWAPALGAETEKGSGRCQMVCVSGWLRHRGIGDDHDRQSRGFGDGVRAAVE